MAKAAQKLSAAQIIATAKAAQTKRGPGDWIKHLPADQRKVMDDIKAKYDAGELNGVQYSDLHRSIKAAFGSLIGYTQFRRWLIGETQ